MSPRPALALHSRADPVDPLAALGLHGLSSVTSPVLAAWVTGDPLLLVGPHGTAKTALVERIAAALGHSFRAYDASKALFEDLIGFPDPSSLAEGRVRYVPTALSLWDVSAVLIDEISRAAPSLQNKWLEVVRARRLMGLPLSDLRQVVAAMNPPGYPGARPLDPALAGRFAYVVRMPTVAEMAPDDVAAIILTRSPEDAPAIPGRAERAATDPEDLVALIERARARLVETLSAQGASLAPYVQGLARQLLHRDIALDGRRLSMIHRSLLACRAVDAERGIDGETADRTFAHLRHLMPTAAMGEPMPDDVLYSAHSRAWDSAVGSVRSTSPAARLLQWQDPLGLAEGWASHIHALTEAEHHEVASRIIRPLINSAADLSARAAALSALRSSLSIIERYHAHLPIDVTSRLMIAWSQICGMNAMTLGELREVLEGQSLVGTREMLRHRFAIELARDEPGQPGSINDERRKATLTALEKEALR